MLGWRKISIETYFLWYYCWAGAGAGVGAEIMGKSGAGAGIWAENKSFRLGNTGLKHYRTVGFFGIVCGFVLRCYFVM